MIVADFMQESDDTITASKQQVQRRRGLCISRKITFLLCYDDGRQVEAGHSRHADARAHDTAMTARNMASAMPAPRQ